MKEKRSVFSPQDDASSTLLERFGDAIIFVALLLVSAVTLAALALATPIVVAIAALIGLFSADRGQKSWRRAGA